MNSVQSTVCLKGNTYSMDSEISPVDHYPIFEQPRPISMFTGLLSIYLFNDSEMNFEMVGKFAG